MTRSLFFLLLLFVSAQLHAAGESLRRNRDHERDRGRDEKDSEERVEPSRRARGSELRGVWIYDPRELDAERSMVQLKKKGFNTVFVRLSSGGAAYYPSKVMPTAKGSGNQLREWADAGRRHGISVHAWHVCFMMHNAPQSDMSAVIKRGEAMMDYKGKVLRPTYKAVVRAPAAPNTLSFEKAAMLELAAQPGIDGVQFDYIRYPIYSADYSPAARKRFEQDTGLKVKNWPADVRRGSKAGEYQRWKQRVVTGIVRDVSRAVRSASPDTEISAAVWSNPTVGRNEFGQDWPTWVREGYLDFVCPMSYTRDEAMLRKLSRQQKQAVEGRIPIYPGLGVYMLSKPAQVNRQISIVRGEGMPGYVLYNFNARTLNLFFPYLEN